MQPRKYLILTQFPFNSLKKLFILYVFVHRDSQAKIRGQLWAFSVLPVDSWDGTQVARLLSKHPNLLSHLTSPWLSPHLSTFNRGFCCFSMCSPRSPTMCNKYSELATKMACVLLLDRPWPLQQSFLQDRTISYHCLRRSTTWQEMSHGVWCFMYHFTMKQILLDN